MDTITIAQPPEAVVIAEIGCNHRGEVQTAKQMIVVAKTCGAAYAKFQKRYPKESLTAEKYASLYDNPNSYGVTYGEHREFLELDISVHAELKAHAEENGIDYTTSVWDMTSARQVAALEPKLIKIPSACNTHLEMLTLLRDEYGGEVHISTGMSTREEIDAAVNVFKDHPQRVVLYACTSGYPVPAEDCCILEILRLRKTYEGAVKEIGFSGHHNGIAIDLACYLLGTRVIERHFTLDRTWKGTDHAASLEPQGLNKLVRDLETTRLAMTYKASEILPIEAVQRKKLKFQS